MALSEEERRGRGCIYSMKSSTVVELKLLHALTAVTDVKDGKDSMADHLGFQICMHCFLVLLGASC